MFFSEPFGGLVPGASGAVLAALLRTGQGMTGRQIHRLVGDEYSLWSVQGALNSLAKLGLVTTMPVGRAHLHSLNEDHCLVAPLRALADPMGALKETLAAATDDDVETVILFGSIARGEATRESDIDLAVIAAPMWDRRAELQEAVTVRCGNHCDVVVFTKSEFEGLAAVGEPVVGDILRDGIALVGSKPRLRKAA
jgi:predicted nucleotidyltransferase